MLIGWQWWPACLKKFTPALGDPYQITVVLLEGRITYDRQKWK
jgi:hypothetical protein